VYKFFIHTGENGLVGDNGRRIGGATRVCESVEGLGSSGMGDLGVFVYEGWHTGQWGTTNSFFSFKKTNLFGVAGNRVAAYRFGAGCVWRTQGQQHRVQPKVRTG